MAGGNRLVPGSVSVLPTQNDVLAVFEKSSNGGGRREYHIQKRKKPPDLQAELSSAVRQGYRPVGLVERIPFFERTTASKRPERKADVYE